MIWSTGVPSAGSACCTPPMPAPGSPWPKRCSASLSDGRWKAITSTTWKCSKSGSPTPSPGGIAIPLRSSGEASAMPGGTAPRRDATGLAGRGPPPTMWFHVASVRSAFTGGSATAAEMASDPLGQLFDARQSLKALPIAIDIEGRPYSLPLEGNHTLIGGESGAGKNSWTWNIVFGLRQARAAKLVKLWALDPKRVELAFGREHWDEYADTVEDMVE